MRWITNITSGRPASYSSKIRATGRCSAQGTMPSWNSVTCWPSRQHHGVLAHQVEPADMAVEVDAHAGPVQPRRDLLDVGRFARAVQPLHHHAAVCGQIRPAVPASRRVEAVTGVDLRHMLVALGEGRHLQVGVDPEDIANRNGLGGRKEVSSDMD
jgi:hypothetical protein